MGWKKNNNSGLKAAGVIPFTMKRSCGDIQELIPTPAWFLWSYHTGRRMTCQEDNRLFPLLFFLFPQKGQRKVTMWQGNCPSGSLGLPLFGLQSIVHSDHRRSVLSSRTTVNFPQGRKVPVYRRTLVPMRENDAGLCNKPQSDTRSRFIRL